MAALLDHLTQILAVVEVFMNVVIPTHYHVHFELLVEAQLTFPEVGV